VKTMKTMKSMTCMAQDYFFIPTFTFLIS
jgi:hypothetical protein